MNAEAAKAPDFHSTALNQVFSDGFSQGFNRQLDIKNGKLGVLGGIVQGFEPKPSH
jgi:hypothetical protein